MHRTVSETVEALLELTQRWKGAEGVKVVICPPFTAILIAAKTVAGSEIRLGAQNLHWAPEGAFTGEVSPVMLQELAVDYVIVGHSERRILFQEDGPAVAKKFAAALENGLLPILCVGENGAEREAGRQGQIVEEQIREVLTPLKEPGKFAIAYEPVWAIGTGKTAEPEDVQRMHGHIRTILGKCGVAAGQVPILYGGSVNASNSASLLSQRDVDGALVGGASLRNDEFLAIAGQAAQLAGRKI
jgi:triosephosphate isomerase